MWTGREELSVLFPQLGLLSYSEDGNKAGFIRIMIYSKTGCWMKYKRVAFNNSFY